MLRKRKPGPVLLKVHPRALTTGDPAAHELAADLTGRGHPPRPSRRRDREVRMRRAALTGHRIADAADFFSFDTDDLTRTPGFSRDDVESSVFATYLDKGVFTVSPVETIDGVGRLVKIAVEEGRRTKPGLKLGVCGEHGGDPEIHPLLPHRRA